jgi:PAT family beta-lactamase induction signal transducer AmpG
MSPADSPAATANTFLPALSESRWARFAVIILLYFMQGVPVGMILIAIPAWLAANGATPVAVGAYVGTIMLPWSLKLFKGLLMDRFTFRPMGRRRSWILAAQTGMIGMFITIAVVSPTADQIELVTALGFFLMLTAVFNDVAVDGMTVDLVPHEQRTAVNSAMFASQTVGISASGFISGQLLSTVGTTPLALLLGGCVIIATTVVMLFRERRGERLLPWSRGQASPECEALQQDAWWPILKALGRALLNPITILFLVGKALSLATFAFTDAVAPTLAVQQLGWSDSQYSHYASLTSLISAGMAAVLTTLFVKWVGIRRAVILITSLLIVAALFGAMTYATWEDSRVFAALFFIQYSFALLLQIILMVWAMRLCNPAVAASLFALFMAIPNFGRAILSGSSGWVIEGYGYSGAYMAVAIVMGVSLLLVLLGRVGRERSADAANQALIQT